MRRQTIHLMQRLLLLIAVVTIGMAGVVLWQRARGEAEPLPLAQLWRPFLPLAGRRIGIVAGHSGNDPGAVCPDGLTEAQVNMMVAEAVVRELRARGATVDLLAEFDERLAGYRADAFVSIRAPSSSAAIKSPAWRRMSRPPTANPVGWPIASGAPTATRPAWRAIPIRSPTT